MKLPYAKPLKPVSLGSGFIHVYVLAGGIDSPLTYCCACPLPPVGARVKVPLRGRVMWAVVCAHVNKSDLPKVHIKPVAQVLDEPPMITLRQMQLCQFVANYYHVCLGHVFKLCLPPATGKQTTARQRFWIKPLTSGEVLSKRCTLLQRVDDAIRACPQGLSDECIRRQFPRGMHHVQRLIALKRVSLTQTPLLPSSSYDNTWANMPETICLNQQQKQAVHAILYSKEQSPAFSPGEACLSGKARSPSKAFLLEGVTGSGKTQVYIHVARALLDQGKSVLIIAPEIALTPLLTQRFSQALGQHILLLHSGLTAAQRRDTLFTLRQDKPHVVVGARSALFAPLHNLGLIVLDEEHDSSFKQEAQVPYHGRNVALWRGKNENATVILGSATPCLESLHNVAQGKLQHLHLTQRVGAKGALPQVHVVDLRSRWQHEHTRKQDQALTAGQSLCVLSQPLQDAMAHALKQRQQVMLFLNRRGYSAFALCSSCGTLLSCPHCSVSLTFHKKRNALRCHQCDYTCPMQPVCPHCGLEKILTLGLGVERVQEEVKLHFPHARIARLDRDAASNTRSLHRVLQNMQQGKTDVLIGTQMIAKGHDFPQVAVVGVVLADTGLCMPDFRASEQTFQMLTQVAGRAGRGETRGEVFIQTFNPQHPAIQFAQQHDNSGFTHKEMQLRLQHNQPPFSRSVLLRVQGKQEQAVQQTARAVYRQLHDATTQRNGQHAAQLLGPAPAPVTLLRGYFRYHIYLRASCVQTRARCLYRVQQDTLLQKEVRRRGCRLSIDVDPMFFL